MGIIKTIQKRYDNLLNLYTKNLSLENKNIIVSGANSGIGFELVKKIAIKNNVIALANYKTNNLDNINNGKIKILKNDFKELKFSEQFINEIYKFRPQILINCAATFGPEDQELEKINFKNFNEVMKINVFVPINLINFCVKNLDLKQIVNISSDMGSISTNKVGGYYYYRLSKCMLNALSKNLSIDLKTKRINVFCIHPGNVKTKMNTGGLISTEMAAQKIINICSDNNLNYRGKFIDTNGKILT